MNKKIDLSVHPLLNAVQGLCALSYCIGVILVLGFDTLKDVCISLAVTIGLKWILFSRAAAKAEDAEDAEDRALTPTAAIDEEKGGNTQVLQAGPCDYGNGIFSAPAVVFAAYFFCMFAYAAHLAHLA